MTSNSVKADELMLAAAEAGDADLVRALNAAGCSVEVTDVVRTSDCWRGMTLDTMDGAASTVVKHC